MKKKALFFSATILTMAISFSAFAGTWQQDSTGYRYLNDDGTYSANTWQWIDGNADNIAENYYFDANGYCLMNTSAPDGNVVDANGAWILNGVVQTQILNPAPIPAAPAVNTSEAIPSETGSTAALPDITAQVWLPATGEKYHKIPDCGRMNPDKAHSVSRSEAENKGYTPCSKCY